MRLLNIRRLRPDYDDPELCERCGRPITQIFEVEDSSSTLHVFGSKCIKVIIPKTDRWFDLYLEALESGIVDSLGGPEVAISLEVNDLKQLIEFVTRSD